MVTQTSTEAIKTKFHATASYVKVSKTGHLGLSLHDFSVIQANVVGDLKQAFLSQCQFLFYLFMFCNYSIFFIVKIH